MKVTQHEMTREAYRILAECQEMAPDAFEGRPRVTFKISARMTRAAGKAWPHSGEIKLSLAFFEDRNNFEKEFRNTVTHEVAHILSPPIRTGRKKSSHGPAWKAMHRRLGGTGERCHTLDLATGYERQTRGRAVRTEVACPKCGQPMSLGPTQMKRHRAGARYSHAKCPRF